MHQKPSYLLAFFPICPVSYQVLTIFPLDFLTSVHFYFYNHQWPYTSKYIFFLIYIKILLDLLKYCFGSLKIISLKLQEGTCVYILEYTTLAIDLSVMLYTYTPNVDSNEHLLSTYHVSHTAQNTLHILAHLILTIG